jgi:hypothetical protein
LPTPEQKEKLDTLLQIPKGERTSRFDYYRKGPVTISAPAFNEAMKRYLELQAFGFGNFDCSHIPPVRLKNLARYAGIISAKKIARMPDDKRAAILVAFVRTFEIIALNDALDLLDLLTTGISRDAKKIGQKNVRVRFRTIGPQLPVQNLSPLPNAKHGEEGNTQFVGNDMIAACPRYVGLMKQL